MAENEEITQKEDKTEKKSEKKPKDKSSEVKPQADSQHESPEKKAPKVEPPQPDVVQMEAPPLKPGQVEKEAPPPKPEQVEKEAPPPKPKPKVKEEKKEEKPPKPKKERSKDKPKVHKEGDKAPSGVDKTPKEKKGGDKEERGKPKEEPKTKEKKDEFLIRFSPLIFGKYDMSEVVVEDPGLRRYINLQPVGLPHSGAKHANKSFGKTKVNIVERLINNMMRTEHSTGKKSFMYKTVNKSFDIIAKRTKQNPVQVLIIALQNSSPKEEITRLRFGGISVPKAVDTSASHRLDVALRNICKGAISSSHKNKKRMAVCLAEELI